MSLSLGIYFYLRDKLIIYYSLTTKLIFVSNAAIFGEPVDSAKYYRKYWCDDCRTY